MGLPGAHALNHYDIIFPIQYEDQINEASG